MNPSDTGEPVLGSLSSSGSSGLVRLVWGSRGRGRHRVGELECHRPGRTHRDGGGRSVVGDGHAVGGLPGAAIPLDVVREVSLRGFGQIHDSASGELDGLGGLSAPDGDGPVLAAVLGLPVDGEVDVGGRVDGLLVTVEELLDGERARRLVTVLVSCSATVLVEPTVKVAVWPSSETVTPSVGLPGVALPLDAGRQVCGVDLGEGDHGAGGELDRVRRSGRRSR